MPAEALIVEMRTRYGAVELFAPPDQTYMSGNPEWPRQMTIRAQEVTLTAILSFYVSLSEQELVWLRNRAVIEHCQSLEQVISAEMPPALFADYTLSLPIGATDAENEWSELEKLVDRVNEALGKLCS